MRSTDDAPLREVATMRVAMDLMADEIDRRVREVAALEDQVTRINEAYVKLLDENRRLRAGDPGSGAVFGAPKRRGRKSNAEKAALAHNGATNGATSEPEETTELAE